MKAQKTLSLDLDVARRLDEEENQSAKVQELLREDYGMEEQTDN